MIPCHPYPGKWLDWRSLVKSYDRLHREIPALMVLRYRHPNSANVILQDLTPGTEMQTLTASLAPPSKIHTPDSKPMNLVLQQGRGEDGGGGLFTQVS
jgi:hypothetical protein